jgi:hypothetical protein
MTQSESIKELKKLLKPGQTVFTILRHVSSSGMSRVIDLVIVVADYRDEYPKNADGSTNWDAKPTRKLIGHKPRSIGYLAAEAMDDRWDSDKQGIKVGGCGMDMGFHLVYNLGRTLYPHGVNCAGRMLCQSNDHVNPGPDRGNYDRRHKHRDSGYAFKQSWL